jgi:two-component system sensor histidine kinase VicK
VSVRDTGIGISSKDTRYLFDRYYRVEDAATKYIAGFGIGLYLSAEIVARHNGKIWVESEPGVGSTFYFSLKLD